MLDHEVEKVTNEYTFSKELNQNINSLEEKKIIRTPQTKSR